MEAYTAIGLMSGTALDGIDVALIRTDGETVAARDGFMSIPYTAGLRALLRASLHKTAAEAAEAEQALTDAHAQAVADFLQAQGVDAAEVDVIGFHGHTLHHAPEKGYTCQIGDGARLAALTGIDVVNDFRSHDVAMGGQGAPLAPVYHRALAAGLGRPLAFLNIGGVANVTYIGADDAVVAFDTGPGNALLDDWVLARAGVDFDRNGDIARAGLVDAGVLARLLAHPYFGAPPPKSLERDFFVSDAWAGLSLEDGAATLCAFTVESVAAALAHMPQAPERWVVCGGGRLNAYMMAQLRARLGADVVPVEDFGLNGCAIEAEAFAYMAVRCMRGLPISFPRTTGVAHPLSGGKVHRKTGKAA